MQKGKPQGGVLSPLLWNLVIESLSITLKNIPHKPDFSDDLVTAVTGDHLQTVIQSTQHIMNNINRWCEDNDLELSPHKTSVVLFTRKRGFTVDTPVTLANRSLSYFTDVRYLGVISDHKLNWTKHVDHVTTKACNRLCTAQRTIGKNWGYSTKTTKWKYKSVVLPTVTYGCHTWGLNPKSHIRDR